MRYVDAIFRSGKIEPLSPLSLSEGSRVKIVVPESDESIEDAQRASIRRLRGQFRGSLSSSDAFSQRKTIEKAMEE